MRTTVRLDEHLLAQAKRHAAESGKTLAAVLEQALRESLARSAPQPKAKRVRLKTVKGGGVRAGVELDDSVSLLDLMGPEVNLQQGRRASGPGHYEKTSVMRSSRAA